MVHVAPAVVSDRRPDRLRHLVEAMQQVLDRELGELRIRLECLVQVVDVGFVMLVVMEFHRLRIDVRLKRVVAEPRGLGRTGDSCVITAPRSRRSAGI